MIRKTFFNNPISCALLSLSVLLTAPAQALVSSSLVQLTDSQNSLNGPIVDSSSPDISADGSTVAFYSNADLVAGQNSAHVDAIFVMNSDGTGLRQLTVMTVGDSRDPRLSADGSVVVFASSADLISGENPPESIIVYPGTEFEYTEIVRSYQIFIMNTDGTGLRQLTHGSGGDAENPDITDDGNTIVFQSSQDLRDENADGTVELFVVNADGTGLMQITAGAPKIAGKRDDASRDAAISADGSKIAFDSFADLTSPLNDDFSNEVFVFDLASYLANGRVGALSNYTLQLTDTDIEAPGHVRAEDAFEASISADGAWIAFSACIYPTTNPSLADAIWVIKSDGTSLTQLTFVNDIRDDSRLPTIAADGSAVTFTSRADLVAGSNLDKNYELFVASADGTWLVQATDHVSTASHGQIRTRVSAAGTEMVYPLNANLTGDNPDFNREIFLQSVVLSVSNPPAGGGDDDHDDERAATVGSSTGDATVSDGVGTFAFAELLIALLALTIAISRSTFLNQHSFRKAPL
jgi:Tol biopolymer transport system component